MFVQVTIQNRHPTFTVAPDNQSMIVVFQYSETIQQGVLKQNRSKRL